MSILILSPIYIYVVFSLHVFRFLVSLIWRFPFIFAKFEWGGATRCSLYTKVTVMTSVAETDVNLNILYVYTDTWGLHLAFEDIRNFFFHLGSKITPKARPNLMRRPKVKSGINIRLLYYFHSHCDIWVSLVSICILLNKIIYFWYNMAECIHL